MSSSRGSQACWASSSSSRQRPRSPPSQRHDEAYHPPIGFLPPSEEHTLAVPFALAYIMWSHTCKAGCSSHNAHSSGRPHHHGPICALGPAAEHGEVLKNMDSQLRCIGTSFKKCMHEMRSHVMWDDEFRCVKVDDVWSTTIDADLRDFGYYEDALGRVQVGMLPKCADKEAATTYQARNKQANKSQPTERSRDKMREQLQSDSLLADCQRFASKADADAAQRKDLANNTPLAQALRALNRAVLAFGTRHSDNLIYTELAALVALLNYAAAFYRAAADEVKEQLSTDFGQKLVENCFLSVCSPRWTHIEAEEYAASRTKSRDRNERRRKLQSIALGFVPDTMELRDGVQLVLHTFVWINYTAFRSADEAMAAMLHSLIPLLQTVLIRCAKQTFFLQRLLCLQIPPEQALCPSTPYSTVSQWDLIWLSTILQTLSGSNLVLYTSYYNRARRTKKRRPHVESAVQSAAMASLYTMYAICMTLETLQSLVEALATPQTWYDPRPEECKRAGHTCYRGCGNPDSNMLIEVASFDKALTRLERTQFKWTTRIKAKKSRKKKVAAGADEVRIDEIQEQLFHLFAYGYGYDDDDANNYPKPVPNPMDKVWPKKVDAKPAVANPPASTSPASKPVVSKPAVSKPVVSKPVVSKPVASKPVASKPAVSNVATPVPAKVGSGKDANSKPLTERSPAKTIGSDMESKAAPAAQPVQGPASKTAAKPVYGPEPPPRMPVPLTSNIASLIELMADNALAQPDYVAPPLSELHELPQNLATLASLMTSPSWQPPAWMGDIVDQLSKNDAASRGILELAGAFRRSK